MGSNEYFDRAETDIKNIAAVHSQCLCWVKMRNTQPEQMFSGLPPEADIDRGSRHVSNVPKADIPMALPAVP
jgi:tryptophanase